MPITGPTDKTDDWIRSTIQRNPFRRYVDPTSGQDLGNWLTAPARLSFPHVFKAQAAMEEGGKDKFSATFLFPEGVNFEEFRVDLNRCGQEKWGAQFGAYAQQESFNKPLKDQAAKSQYEGYLAGNQFFTASGERKPQVTNPRGTPIADETKVYPGCWVIGIVRPFAFEARNRQGAVVKRGVSVGLQALCVIADDKEFGGGAVDAVKAFAGVHVEGASYDAEAAFAGADAGQSAGYASIL